MLLLILLLSAILRLWDLGGMPPHLRNDEAALGYNGYSILKTAKDEHGDFLPLFFQSFGDFKPGLYVYLTVPFIAIFGLNEVSVRLPSAIFGVISVWLFYEIVLYIFVKRSLALISALVLAISPLFITFSRGAWEVSVSFALTLAATLFFLKAVFKEKYLLLSALFFGLTLLTSHTAKLSSPLFLIILSIAYFKQVKKISRQIIYLSLITFIIFTVPVALSFIQGKVARLQTLSIFSYNLNAQDNFRSIASRWFSLYSPSTLFFKGDTNPQHTPSQMGPLFFLDSIFLILGMVILIRAGTRQQNLFVWLSLILLSLPSSLTIEKINFERVLPMFIPLAILTSIGINSLWNPKKNITVIIVFLYALNYLYFLDQYFVHAKKKNDAWQMGYKQIVEKVTLMQGNYQKIIVQQSLEQPYIFFLFYKKYDPSKYQEIVRAVFVPNETGKDIGLVSRIDNIEFKDIDWSVNKPDGGNLYIMPTYKLDQQQNFYQEYQLVDEIKDLNGFPLFKIVKI